MWIQHSPQRQQLAQPTVALACRPLLDLKTTLGEGLLWDAQRGRLLMTDIVHGQLLDIDIDTGVSQNWTFDEPLAWVLKTQRPGTYLLGMGSGIARFEIDQPQHLHWINREFPGHRSHRLNDACVDARGLVWLGSMNSARPLATDGQLASFSPQQGMRIHDQHFTVTNGPVISGNGQHLYLNDTLQGKVYRYSLSADGTTLSDRQIFAQFESAQGYPDGMCFDSRGHLWVALWGAASVVEINPEGIVVRQVAVPAKNVTNVCFGGPRLDRMIVSTAAMDMSSEENRQYPKAGGLFEILDHGCVGLPTYSVNMDAPWT